MIIAKNLYRFDNSKDLETSVQDFTNLIQEICKNFKDIPKEEYNASNQKMQNFFEVKNNPSKVLHFLGSSDSGTNPIHNCKCSACESYRKKGIKNLSTSAFLQLDSKDFIFIDCGIDESSHLFDGVKIRAIFLTHFHADHCLRILKLRYSQDKIICFHPKDKEGFSDLFKHKKSIIYKTLEPFEKILIDEISITAIPLQHSKPTFGYFIETKNEKIAYLTDYFKIKKESLEFLKTKNIDICYIDAEVYLNTESNSNEKR